MCVDRPVLSLDRPFSYLLPDDLPASVGTLVRVPFHGRATRGWVLGPTDDVPPRILPVRDVVSPVPAFDPAVLEVLRWVAERYVSPLATVIGRSRPPRVASEETGWPWPPPPGAVHGGRIGSVPGSPGPFAAHRGGDVLGAIARGEPGAFVLRPVPEERSRLLIEAVAATLSAGGSAIVLVPEARPLPAAAASLVDAFGDHVALYLGGDRRSRYRTWLDILAGNRRVVVGTRPAVFAPVPRPGLLWVSREHHPAHREERAPAYHVREVALARAELEGAVCVVESVCPTLEAASAGLAEVTAARRSWPPVEVVRPGPEGRAPRLVAALREASRAFLYAPVPGYGVAQVCRSCGEPAACAACGGLLRAEGGTVRCVVCEAEGVCARCGARDLGIRRGGAERVEEWAATVAAVPVRRAGPRHVGPPERAGVVVGGPEAVGDVANPALDLVGILDADRAGRRPGLAAAERALATWMEVASWARPAGRVIVQASAANDPAIQALVAGSPARFHRAEAERRARAGFPPGAPVFRVAGSADLPARLEALQPLALLATASAERRRGGRGPSRGDRGGTVCLVTLEPGAVAAFGRLMRELAAGDVVDRVEAEPHL